MKGNERECNNMKMEGEGKEGNGSERKGLEMKREDNGK
jgi:hypothetical protein